VVSPKNNKWMDHRKSAIGGYTILALFYGLFLSFIWASVSKVSTDFHQLLDTAIEFPAVTALVGFLLVDFSCLVLVVVLLWKEKVLARSIGIALLFVNGMPLVWGIVAWVRGNPGPHFWVKYIVFAAFFYCTFYTRETRSRILGSSMWTLTNVSQTWGGPRCRQCLTFETAEIGGRTPALDTYRGTGARQSVGRAQGIRPRNGTPTWTRVPLKCLAGGVLQMLRD